MSFMQARGITFDVGGTLDGPGIPWRPRFFELYREHGVLVPGREAALERAFYDADDNLPSRHRLACLDFAATVRLQVEDTLANFGAPDAALAGRVASAFVEESRATLREALPLLERLARRFRLGVVSNNFGNLKDVLRGEG